MPTYKEIFDRIPSVDELNKIKRDLKGEKNFTKWEDYYWAVKNLCVYDTDSCETDIIVSNINSALDNGLNIHENLRIYFDAIKILVTLYSQAGEYETAISNLKSLMDLDVEVPDWVYHYEAMAEIKTERIGQILKDPNDFIDNLSRNSKASSAVTRRQRNAFKQFLIEAEKYIQLHNTVDIDRVALTEAATKYGINNTDGWRYFVSTIPEENVECNDYRGDILEQDDNEEDDAQKRLQGALFGTEEIPTITNRVLEKKYADMMQKLEMLEHEMETKRHELEENTARLESLNQKNEELISHAQADKEKRQALLAEIQKQQIENKALKDEIEKANAIKISEMEKVKIDPNDEIISNIHLYLYSAQVSLASWLGKYLPQSTVDWWKRAVLDCLSYEQRERAQEQNISTITQFDLAALLRISSKNWRRLSNVVYLSKTEYDCLQEMFNIRNRWAHMKSDLPSIEDIKTDIDTISDFMGQVGCSMQSIKEARKFSASLTH